MRLCIASILIWLGSFSVGVACFAPPPEIAAPMHELVARTDIIVLAKAVRPHPKQRAAFGRFANRQFGARSPVPFFKVIEALKGDPGRHVVVPNGAYWTRDQIPPQADYNGHREPLVWSGAAFRAPNTPACTVEPNFREGETYLLFLGHPHWRGYERIATADDLWLATVRRMIADPTVRIGVDVTRAEWLKMHAYAFFGRVESCVGPTIRVTEVLKGDLPRLWRPPPGSVPMRQFGGKPHAARSHRNGLPCVEGRAVFALGHGPQTYEGRTRLADAFPISDGEIFLAPYERRQRNYRLTGPDAMSVEAVRQLFD
ncbi:hypothetical protein [Pseudaestuariivita atlantica]|uniref:Uncharacterized protein n=1 Tax=Pseudaestuariivita atlantica TaxID=1317121 RepID=A0A0L1JPZ6_9RHOB|nr:hypothetical protein [Pseudaestuariivita atlantica]KNG93797.1 hypothetical protein ATO11_11535 [Pseudaestuariivita atlantica]